MSTLPEPYPSDCISHWNQTNLEEGVMSSVRPRYTQSVSEQYFHKLTISWETIYTSNFQTCQRFCLQHMIMKSCDCFEPQLDMSLMNVTKFDFKSGIRPCNFDAGDGLTTKKYRKVAAAKAPIKLFRRFGHPVLRGCLGDLLPRRRPLRHMPHPVQVKQIISHPDSFCKRKQGAKKLFQRG